MKSAMKATKKSDQVIHEINSELAYTPDASILSRFKRQLFFVYDDMMNGGTKSDLIVEASVSGKWPLANVYTDDTFFFWKKELGSESFPVALDKDVTGFYHGNSFDKAPAKIWGELYAIRPSQFKLLDNEKENGVQFIRRQVSVTLPYYHGASKFPDTQTYDDVWMYVGVHEYWDDQLAGIHSSRPIEKVINVRGPHYRYK